MDQERRHFLQAQTKESLIVFISLKLFYLNSKELYIQRIQNKTNIKQHNHLLVIITSVLE